MTGSVYANQTTSGVTITSKKYSLNGGPLQPYTSPFSFSSEGKYTIDAQATDSAGNVVKLNPAKYVYIDMTAPTVGFSVNGSSFAQTSVSTSVYASDVGGSGIDPAALKYVWKQSTSAPSSGTTWTNFTNGAAITQSGVNGDWYLHIQAKDMEGNPVNTASGRFRLYVQSHYKNNTENQVSC